MQAASVIAVAEPRARRMPTLADVYDPRRNNFDAIRFVLAAMVVWSHCYALGGRHEDLVFAFSRQIDGGSLAVDGFFVLSGFLVTQSWAREPAVGTYCRKRALRILPALVVALVFGAFVIAPFGVADPAAYLFSGRPWAHFEGVVLHRHLAIPGAFATNPLPGFVNASLWSLRYEIFCYGLVVAIGVWTPRRWPTLTVALFAAAWATFAALYATGHDLLGVPLTTSRLVACFAGRMLLYSFRARVPADGVTALAAGAIALATFRWGGFRVVFPLVGGYLLLRLACAASVPLQRFGRHGDFSYGVYVYAYPIQQLAVWHGAAALPLAALWLVAFVPTLALAVLSWRWVEAPALALKHGRPRPAPTDGRNGHRRIAYFINRFPNYIETMIYREVVALRARGHAVATFSIRRPTDDEVPADARPLAAATRYILPASPALVVRRHASALLRHPVRYWVVLAGVVGGRHASARDRFRSLCHFVEGVVVLPEVRALGIDQLHAHWAVGAATCAMVVSRFLDVPFSFTAHAYDIWREQLLLPEKLAAARMVVTCTDYNRRHLIATYGADPAKLNVVHHGVDVEHFAPARDGADEPAPLVLAVGRLVPQKGYDRLVAACARLAAGGVDFRCEIVGDGPLRDELIALARRLGVGDRVRLRPRLFHDELVRRYAAAAIFSLACVPADDGDRDGIPNTMIEAMAMELPVVATRFSGIPELVVDGETGLLVDDGDVDALATALGALLRDPARRRAMGRAGRRRVLDGFTVEASVARLDGLLAAVAGA